MSDRNPAQRAQDDEDHRLAMCGFTPDERSGEELEDFKQRHFDFNIFGGPQVCSSGLIAANWPRVIPTGPSMGAAQGEDPARRASSEYIFASGLPRPTPHDAKQGPGGVGRSAIPASGVATSLGPAPLSTT